MILSRLNPFRRRLWVYHYHATRQIPEGVQHCDGWVAVRLQPTNTDLYRDLKTYIASIMGDDVDPQTMILRSLTLIGRK